jgi:hypothetical protein
MGVGVNLDVARACDNQGLVDWLEVEGCCYGVGAGSGSGGQEAGEPALVEQIKRSVSRLDASSDIGLENLVNVLHHFAFGDSRASGAGADGEARELPEPSEVGGGEAGGDEAVGEEGGSVNCRFLHVNSGLRDLLLEDSKLVDLESLGANCAEVCSCVKGR